MAADLDRQPEVLATQARRDLDMWRDVTRGIQIG
jgi:hypothetical protein